MLRYRNVYLNTWFSNIVQPIFVQGLYISSIVNTENYTYLKQYIFIPHAINCYKPIQTNNIQQKHISL